MYDTKSKMESRSKTDSTKKTNKTGLPDRLKYGIESISGYRMDDVRVHYNSSKPAQLQSLAYAQGNDIYVAQGQERHLGHEAWHVVQQKQGRVTPTEQMKGININSDQSLEHEADVMGAKAIQMQCSNPDINLRNASAVPCVQKEPGDLVCTARISYRKGGPGDVEATGENNARDREHVINTFKEYRLMKLAGVPQESDSNSPGQCAEPHAVSNALKEGNSLCGIERIHINAARITKKYHDRIKEEIDSKKPMSDSDKKFIEALLTDNKQNYELEDIIYGDQEKKQDFLSLINSGNAIRSFCRTCRQWIYNSGNVVEQYLKTPERVELENQFRSISDGLSIFMSNIQDMLTFIQKPKSINEMKKKMRNKQQTELKGNIMSFIELYTDAKNFVEENDIDDNMEVATKLLIELKEIYDSSDDGKNANIQVLKSIMEENNMIEQIKLLLVGS